MKPILERICEAYEKVRLSMPLGMGEPFVLVASESVRNELRKVAVQQVSDVGPIRTDLKMTVFDMDVVEARGISDFVVLSRFDVERLANAVGGILLTDEQLIEFNEWCDWKIDQTLHNAGSPAQHKKGNNK